MLYFERLEIGLIFVIKLLVGAIPSDQFSYNFKKKESKQKYTYKFKESTYG